ncbi:MAG TPA: glycoside hydrolase [Allosphingosinicella sp.]
MILRPWKLLAIAAVAATCASASPAGAIAPPPAALRLDPFYAKYLDAGGIPVIGSARAPDAALAKARDIVLAMLAHRPDLKAELARGGARVGVMAADEATTDLPEQSGWKKPARDDPRLTQCELKYFERIEAMSDRDYWNARARGTGGLFTTVGAENLLASPGGRYFGENILVHEFSHAIFGAVEKADPALYAAAARAFDHARAAGLWKGDYAAVTLQEYWAEGTQFWFNDNMLARLDGADIVSDRDLARYDPALHAVLARAYGRAHRIAADPFYKHPARLDVPVGYRSAEC